MTKQSVYIIVGLLSALLLVGVANLYFMLKTEDHIHVAAVEYDEEESWTDYAEAVEGEKGRESASAKESRSSAESGQKPAPATTPPAGPGTAGSQTAAAQPPAPSRNVEINVPQWVNRSIPLTFESRGGAADSVRMQYEHVVRDLQAVQQHLVKGESEQAMALIRPMLWDRSNIYREDAEWYQVLANISAGNKETATNQLNRLLRDNIHLYYFLGRELHAELVPIRELMQQQVRRDGGSDRPRTGY